MSLMMPVFKRGQMGTVTHKFIGAEHWPHYQAQGWYDADDKVPLNPGQVPPEQPAPVYNAPVKPYGAFGSVLGETPPVPQVDLARGKGGRFAKGSGGKRR